MSETCQKCAASEYWWAGIESRKLAQENWDEMRKRLHDFHTSDHERAKFSHTVPNCGADACRVMRTGTLSCRRTQFGELVEDGSVVVSVERKQIRQ